MTDNAQTTDPLAEENQAVQYDDYPDRGVLEADITLPMTVRDPGKGNNGGAPLWSGSDS